LVQGVTQSLFQEQEDGLLASLHNFAEPQIDPTAAALYGRLSDVGFAAG
jgi:hypothetical protein